MGWQDWIGHVSYALLALSYVVTHMLALRLLAIAALAFESLYLYFGSETPLWVGIAWAGVFIAINVAQVAVLIRNRLRASLDEQQKALRRWFCPELDDLTFSTLFKVSLPVVFHRGDALCVKGEPVPTLFVLLTGEADVAVQGRHIRRLRAGSLVGEVSYLHDDLASADVVADGAVRARAFPKAALRELAAKHEAIRDALNQTIAKTLATKLAQRAQALA